MLNTWGPLNQWLAESGEQNQSGTGTSSVRISGTAIGAFINAQEQSGSGTVRSLIGGSAVGSYINEQHQAGFGVVTSRVSGAVIGSFVNNTGSEQHYAGIGAVTSRVGGVAIGSFINEQNFAGTGQSTVTVSGEVVGSYSNLQRQAGGGTVTVRVTGTVIGSFINEVAPPPEPELGWGNPISLFAEAEAIEQISLTFDQLGRPLVFYRTGADTLKLYWYDPVLQESVNVQIATGIDPQAGFDFPQDTGQSFTDALLFYVRDDTVYMRIQRDRFSIEYPCPANQPGLRITSNGLRVDNRYQVVYEYLDDGYTPPVVPVPPVVVIPPGEPAPTPDPSEPPPIVIVGEYCYLNSWGSCFVTNYRLDVVNDPFKIGFTVKEAFFPRYTEKSSAAFPFKQGQVMFGSDGRKQLYCYISRDTRNNRAVANIWRGGNEYSQAFTLNDFNGVWEFEFRGLDSRVTITKDGVVLFDDIFRRPRPDRSAPTLLTFAGGLYETNTSDTYAFHGIQHNCWVEHGGNRIDWAVKTKGEQQQPSVPAGTDMTIFNHRPQNWRFIQP
ncbi:hypothetical protein [Arsukibacterium indicum]|uniref:GLUG domain-containing protein n=1 Tax=Arsukibacterium indicum TaxID=2848612 RepID=A0ABS6MH80_9GAMM|nr:hypothetical protein [Arsukibacterium indicum]MBV2128152.1 hypothetical protein [Arsukibacterium indicum]